MGRIDADELPAGFVEPDFLRPVQDGHRLAVCHPIQHLCLVERLDEPEGQQRLKSCLIPFMSSSEGWLGEKIKGRKEHIVVDTLGLPMGVVVHVANIHDSVGAHSVIDAMQGCFP